MRAICNNLRHLIDQGLLMSIYKNGLVCNGYLIDYTPLI